MREGSDEMAAQLRPERPVMRALVLSLVLLVGAPALAAAAEPPPRVAGAPDFSEVRTRADAERLVGEGRLVRVLLYPGELGGEDAPANVTYLTPEAAQARERIVGTLTRFTEKGLIDKLSVEPTYRGDSHVPASITYRGAHSTRSGVFEPVIQVW